MFRSAKASKGNKTPDQLVLETLMKVGGRVVRMSGVVGNVRGQCGLWVSG